jgi:hypothetical protein
MDTLYDIWLADRRLHRTPRTIVRRRPATDAVAA